MLFVCDREADIYDYLAYKLSHDERFVVRAKHLREVEEANTDLLSHLQAQSVVGGYQVQIPQKGMKGKAAKLKIDLPAQPNYRNKAFLDALTQMRHAATSNLQHT